MRGLERERDFQLTQLHNNDGRPLQDGRKQCILHSYQMRRQQIVLPRAPAG